MPGRGKGKGKAGERGKGKTVPGGNGETVARGKRINSNHVDPGHRPKWNDATDDNLLDIICRYGELSIRILNWATVYEQFTLAMGTQCPSINACQSRWSRDLRKPFEALMRNQTRDTNSKAPQPLPLPAVPPVTSVMNIPYAGSSRHRPASLESPYPDPGPTPPSRSHGKRAAASSSNAEPLPVSSPVQDENALHRVIHLYNASGEEVGTIVLPDKARRIEIKDTFSIPLPPFNPIDPVILAAEQQHLYTPVDNKYSPLYRHAYELDIVPLLDAEDYSTPSKAQLLEIGTTTWTNRD